MITLVSRPLALASLLATAGPALAVEVPGSAFTAGPHWRGYAEADERGQLLFCSVSITHGAGQQLWVLLGAEDTFSIVLNTGIDRFTPGEELTTLVSINDEPPFQAFATATDAQNLLMTFPKVDHSIAYLRQSGLLSIVVSPTLTVALGTPDIAPALDAARACLTKFTTPG